jgi:hypothetical protein
VAVAALGFLLFNYPLLRVFDVDVLVLGVPLVWLYVFIAWALVIALVGLVMRDP